MVKTQHKSDTLILTGGNVRAVLDMKSCIDAVEQSFRASGTSIESKILGFQAATGGFHVKAALDSAAAHPVFAAKINANFPGNSLRQLPTIQGVIVLFEAESGRVLALIDSISVTLIRTAAASAVAARALSRPDARTLSVIGCGAQAEPHLRALQVVRALESVSVFDQDEQKAAAFAAAMTGSIPITVARSVADCTDNADIIVTCTSSKRAFLAPLHVRDGAFVAAVGADNVEKQEILPELMASASVFTDSTEQCAEIGDLHHAIDAGVITRDSVRGNLGDVLRDFTTGRSDEAERIIFDSTGVAFQDVACAWLAYSRARERSLGLRVQLSC